MRDWSLMRLPLAVALLSVVASCVDEGVGPADRDDLEPVHARTVGDVEKGNPFAVAHGSQPTADERIAPGRLAAQHASDRLTGRHDHTPAPESTAGTRGTAIVPEPERERRRSRRS